MVHRRPDAGRQTARTHRDRHGRSVLVRGTGYSTSEMLSDGSSFLYGSVVACSRGLGDDGVGGLAVPLSGHRMDSGTGVGGRPGRVPSWTRDSAWPCTARSPLENSRTLSWRG